MASHANQAAAGTAGFHDGVCDHGETCLYRQGRLVYDNWPTFPGQCTSTPLYDYLRNRSGINQRAWSGTNCTGRFVDVPSNRESSINLFWSLGG